MNAPEQHRIGWLARHILPNEGVLRRWLGRKRLYDIDVDDIIQECYAQLVALKSVDHIDNPRAYMFRTAQSICLQHMRRARIISIETVGDFDDLDLPNDEPSPERRTMDRQALQQVEEALAQLPPKCRQAFILRRVEGLSQREIAKRMGVSENTVEKHVSKGIRLISIFIANGGNNSPCASAQGDPGVTPAYAGPRNQRRDH